MDVAWTVWALMKSEHVVPSPDLYVAMIDGCSRAGSLWQDVAQGALNRYMSVFLAS